jgi:hypothetical protein
MSFADRTGSHFSHLRHMPASRRDNAFTGVPETGFRLTESSNAPIPALPAIHNRCRFASVRLHA